MEKVERFRNLIRKLHATDCGKDENTLPATKE